MSFGSLPSVLGNGGGVAISVIGGKGLFADGTAAAPSISFAADTDTGFYRSSANTVAFSSGGTMLGRFTTGDGTTFDIRNAGSAGISISSGGAVSIVNAGGTNQNITLTPSGTGITVNSGGGYFTGSGTPANGSDGGVEVTGSNTQGNIFAFRRGTGAIPLVLQGAGSNVLIGTSVNSGALLQIGTNTTTSAGGMVFGTDTFVYRTTAGRISLDSTSDPYINIAKNGTIYGHWVSDASNVYFGSSTGIPLVLRTNNTTALTLDSSQQTTFAGYANMAAGLAYRWTGRSGLFSPSDGVITLFNNATSDFTRLQFGGTTSSFPALKRSGSAIHVRFADDSAFAAIASGVHVVSGSASSVGAGEICYGGSTATTVGAAGAASALPALPLGYIIINVAGTSAKIPYYNA